MICRTLPKSALVPGEIRRARLDEAERWTKNGRPIAEGPRHRYRRLHSIPSRRLVRVKALLPFALALLSCNPRTTTREPEAHATSAASVSNGTDACARRGGRFDTAKGDAQNAKMGAVLVDGDTVIYVKGLEAWPEDALERAQSFEGCLAEEKHLPVAERDPSGAISQGTDGDGVVWALERGR